MADFTTTTRIARHPMCSVIWLGSDKNTDQLMLSRQGIPLVKQVKDVYRLSCARCMTPLASIVEGEIWHCRSDQSNIHHYYCEKCCATLTPENQ